MHLRKPTAAAAFVAWLVAVPCAWATQVDLSQPGGNAAAAAVAVDPGGESVAVWTERDQNGNTVVQGAARQGPTYQSVGSLSGQDVHTEAPQVAIDPAANAAAVWDDFEQGHHVVQAAAFTPDGSVTPLGNLSDAGIDAVNAHIVLDPAGNAVAVWQQNDGSSDSIHAAARPAGAGGFVSLGEISRPPMVGSQDDEEPQAAVDSAGDAIVVWEHWDGTNFVVQAALRPAGAANFTLLPNPVSVPQSQPHEDAIGPKVAVDPTGDAVVVWKLGGGPSGNAWKVQAAELPAGGATFTAPQDMSAAGEDAEDPAVAIDNAGNAVAIWQRFDTSGAFIDTASLAAGTSSWNKSELPAMINSLVPDIAVDPAGNALGVWAGPDSVNSSIYSAFRPAGGAFEAPLPLSTAGQNAVDPHVVLDQTGDAFAVWERSDGHNTIATAYLPTPPPTGPPIPPLPPPGGCTPHPGLPCPPGQPQPQPPRLLSLRLTPGTFSAAGRLVHGHCVRPMATNRANRRCTRAVTLKVSLVLPAAATVAFTVQRAMTGHLGHHRCITNRRGNAHGHRCTRFVTLSGSVSRHGHTGANTFVYRHRALTPGSYRLLATPSIGGQIGTAAVVPFKVVS